VKRIQERVAVAVLALWPALFAPGAALAYSYSAAGAEPLLDGREALLGAVGKGDWTAAAAALKPLQSELAYLDQNEDKGVAAAFAQAVAGKDAQAARKALLRASIDEIQRRLTGARENIKDYQTAKILVVKAQRFYTAIAGDLPPDRRPAIEDGLRRALDAVGNPGVFGVGARPVDPAAYDKAHQDVMKALVGLGAPA
jgi:hypothetical protein